MEPPNQTAHEFPGVFLALHHLQPPKSGSRDHLMDTAQWPEGTGVVKPMEEKKSIRAQKPQALNCPRCNSTHTKFCYYNNYNLSQPRYFCKTCRRYWTAGGSLRNVPVGGGSRKNKRSSSSSSSSSSAAAAVPVAAASISAAKNHQNMMMARPAPNLISQSPSPHIIQNHGGQGQGQDLNLAYTNSRPSSSSAMGFFKTVNADVGGTTMMMNSFAGLSNTMMMNSPGLNASVDGFGNGGGYDDHNDGIIGAIINHQETASTTTTAPSTSARLFFPFEDLKPMSASTSGSGVQGDDSNCNGYWSGGLGGGSW